MTDTGDINKEFMVVRRNGSIINGSQPMYFPVSEEVLYKGPKTYPLVPEHIPEVFILTFFLNVHIIFFENCLSW